VTITFIGPVPFHAHMQHICHIPSVIICFCLTYNILQNFSNVTHATNDDISESTPNKYFAFSNCLYIYRIILFIL